MAATNPTPVSHPAETKLGNPPNPELYKTEQIARQYALDSLAIPFRDDQFNDARPVHAVRP
jgi:hypothetical protein